jgi:hypothetical protein
LVIEDLRNIQLPEGAILFCADAKSMYKNIDNLIGVNALRGFILMNASSLPQSFPSTLFLEILSTVMENNIFEFAGSYWFQMSGTAMGIRYHFLWAS